METPSLPRYPICVKTRCYSIERWGSLFLLRAVVREKFGPRVSRLSILESADTLATAGLNECFDPNGSNTEGLAQ